MKRWILLLFIILMISTVAAFADDIYPLEENEIILETVELADNKVELFTELDGEYYRKIFEKQDNTWVVTDSEIAELPLTGLKIDNDIEKDSEVEEAVENKLRAKGYSLNDLPSELDLSQEGMLPPIGFQYEDSCVGWSVGYYLRTYQEARDIGWEVGDNLEHIFSPSFIYNQTNDGVDKGATLGDAGRLLKEVGAATIADFPYVPHDYLTQPSEEVKEKAKIHRIKDCYVLYNRMDPPEYIIAKTKKYLNTGDLPVAGIKVGFKFMYPLQMQDGTHIVTTQNHIKGGHAVAVVGYDDNLPTPEGYGAFKIINSYGEKWGDHGYAYMTYPAFAEAMCLGYVYTDLVNEQAIENTEEDVPVQINNIVDFQMDFIGTGRYDLFIKDNEGKLVKNESNKKGVAGLNKYIWDGLDESGKIVENGNYQLELIPYTGETPKEPVLRDFTKKTKVDIATAKVYKIDGIRDKLEVNIRAKEDGQASIYALSGDNKETLLKKEKVRANEMITYTIFNSEIDLNDNVMSIKVMIE